MNTSNKESTASRLQYIMQQRNLRQIDILEACMPYCQRYNIKMNKSDISQYVSGKVEPNQNKLFILGQALNVNESWLMGFDVPMDRATQIMIEQPSTPTLSSIERQIINAYRNSDDITKEMVHRTLGVEANLGKMIKHLTENTDTLST